MKKYFGTALTILTFTTLVSPLGAKASTVESSLTNERDTMVTEVLGWSSDKGYIPTPLSSTKPDSHTGRVVYIDEYVEYCIGETVWAGKKHYTRARYESYTSDKTKADSGRVWGTNKTTAESDPVASDLNFYRAKTYWGY